jgi:hypothetical protein
MRIIINKTGEIRLPYQEGLLEWLQENYPFSQYKIIDT